MDHIYSDHEHPGPPDPPALPFTPNNWPLDHYTAIEASQDLLSPSSSSTTTTTISASSSIPSSFMHRAAAAGAASPYLLLPSSMINQINMPLEYPTFYKPLHDQYTINQEYYLHASLISSLDSHVLPYPSYQALPNLYGTVVPYAVQEEGATNSSSQANINMDSNQNEIKRTVIKEDEAERPVSSSPWNIDAALNSCKLEKDDSKASLTNQLEPRMISEEERKLLMPPFLCKDKSLKRKKAQQKRIICVPATSGVNNKFKSTSGECLHSDSWAWRKYGQKPIKGSPYPRGYYRCSSSKGCTARKQVERSRSDPSMLVITYTSDHNHGRTAQKNSNINSRLQKISTATSHAILSGNSPINDTAIDKDIDHLDYKDIDHSEDCDIKTELSMQDITLKFDDEHVDLDSNTISSDNHTRDEDYFAHVLEEIPDFSLTFAARSPMTDDEDPTAINHSNVDPFNLFDWSSSNSCVGLNYSTNW